MKRHSPLKVLFLSLFIIFIFSPLLSHLGLATQATGPLAHDLTAENENDSLTGILALLLGTQQPPPITAVASADPTSGKTPLTVQFTTGSSGPVKTWRWDFNGDAAWDWEGTTAENQIHTYTAVGAYTATLQVEDENGTTNTDTISISVTSADPPTIVFHSNDAQLFSGQSTTLSWTVTGADSITIDQGIGAVNSSGSLSVSPATTIRYTLTATGSGGTASSGVDIHLLTPAPEELVLYINNPVDGHSTPGNTVTVSGIVSQTSALVWVNGAAATVTGETFSTEVDLVPGFNPISATASYNNTLAEDSSWVVQDYDYTPQPDGSFGAPYEELVPDDAAIPSYEQNRFSVITGSVEDEQASPIPNVAVGIKNHPEYGTASTDSEGRFSLPVEGGTTHTVVYDHESYLTAHRKVEVTTNDIAIVDLVRLVVQDSQVSSISFDGNPESIFTHESSLTSDSFGDRSLTMVFLGDNHAWEVDEHGQRIRALSSIDTRATEFTTPEAMPAILPPNSAFTYCSELSVDGAERVEFDLPVVVWVDNFLGFEVGEVVPLGYYDFDSAAWVPENNGVIVALLDNDSDGSVDSLDATGDGVPDDLNSSGRFDDEVAGLDDLSRYPVGATFMRVEVSHFTPHDLNWPASPPSDSSPPNAPGVPKVDQRDTDPKEDKCEADIASSVEPRSRIFHEDIPIPGTGYSLHYSSDRVSGYQTVIDVPLSGATVPASLQGIYFDYEITGQR